MTVSAKGQFGVLVLLTAAGGAYAAENLPALQIDPGLLGPGAAAPAAPAPKPIPAPPSTPAPSSPTSNLPVAESVIEPLSVVAPAPTNKSTNKKPSVKKAATAPASAVAASEGEPALPVVTQPDMIEAPRTVVVPVVAALPAATKIETPPAAPAAPVKISQQPAVAINKLPLLQVDPALLGSPNTKAVAEREVASVTTPALAQGTTARATSTTGKTRPANRKKAIANKNAEAGQAPAQGEVPPQVDEAPHLPATYSAYVEAGILPASELRASPRLEPNVLDPKVAYPVFLIADRIDGRNDAEVVSTGDVELRKAGTVLTGDKLTYWPLEDETEVLGNVRLVRENDTVTGPKLRMRMDDNIGYFETPQYVIKRKTSVAKPSSDLFTQFWDASDSKEKQKDENLESFGFVSKPATSIASITGSTKQSITTGSGTADRINFEGEGQYRMTNATYSTCPVGPKQGWHIEVADLKLDYDRELATGNDGKIVFQGVPILYSPWIDFSLNNQRKSGLLAPHFGTNSINGFEFDQPWYWNIAPNMDATITPREMTKRGLQVNTEVRYKDYNYFGQARYEYLPSDQIANRSRYAYALTHDQNFGYGFSGSLNLNGVSDDRYFTDLSTSVSTVSQSTLLREGKLNYSASWWSAALTAQRYQVLQDTTSSTTIATPYSRLPQLTLTGTRADLPVGLVFNGNAEYVHFSHPTQVIGNRVTLNPQLSLPMQTAAFYMTPKFGLNLTRYTLEHQDATTPQQQTRTLPTFSLDSGVTFERPLALFGKDMTQTLEPRLYYLYVPYRDQSKIPVFDSGLADFNFAQIFSENRYSGGDRIADANQLTAALTTRLIDPNTGAELVRAMVGQRFYFSDQRVTLPDETARTRRSADYLAALSGQIYHRTYLDTAVQYNPNEGRTERFNIGARYQPESGKVVNAGYRYTRDLLGQVDVSGQWPLGGGWYGVGRYNYSTKEKRAIETVGGLEYNAGCWAIRGVLHRLATTAQSQTTSFFIQLELSGFSNIGTNPFDVLKRNVPGYNKVNQGGFDPANFPSMY